MGGEAGFAIGTLLNGLGLVLGAIAIAVSGVTYQLSRAGKVRAFESRVYAQLTNAASRIESLEAQWQEKGAAMTSILDEMVTQSERTAKERRRLYQEHRRDGIAANMPGNAPPDLASMPRDEQLRQVRAFLSGN